ncbi:MAG: efflux RND transporter periplasmic adaptor subunit [Candidatus Kryptonium sp.]|nr:efflux RND transporter periplasmic adaptor subunit [Candidatus Kryptonium sp.]
MKWKIIAAIVFSSLVSLLAGYFLAKEIFPSSVKGFDENVKLSSGQKVLYYRCGMHPWVIADKPGKCHICGMDLTAVYEGEESGSDVVKVDPTIVQNIGVKIEPVRRMELRKSIKTVGVVDYDETKIAVITTKVSGWIEKLYVDYTGKFVRKGEPLFEIYSPDLVTAQEEYLQAINYKQRVSQSRDPNIIEGADQLVESARKRLLYWDISEEQIKELESTKQVRKTLIIYSPVDGVVIEKNIFLGIKVAQGMNLMKIVDLSTVWVYADIYEYELPWVKVGEEAEVEIPYLPGKILKGKISYIYPFLQTETRTVKVRLEFENFGYFLKPDMYVNVIIKSKVAINTIAVPEQSVIRTGKRDIVVVSLGEGRFKSVEVKLGVLADGYYQVLEGLYEGQDIVTSSHFLIDSESNLRAALAGLFHQHYEENKQNQETKKTQKRDKSEIRHEHKDEKSVKSQTPNKAIDPVCGMEVDPKVALSYTYKGENFYFCMKSCLEKFRKNPEKYLKK